MKQSGSLWRVHRSTDGGATWELASPTPGENGNNNNQPIYLDVDGTNPDKLWCVLTGNQNGHKILRSEDAGETWEDWSTATIAGQRVVSLAHQRGTNGGVYIGTTQAVYYRDAEMDDWLLYNTGLPMINVCTFMQADYCGGHIRTAGTRGVHQAEFYAPSEVLSGFMADRTRINLASPCQVSPIHFSAVPVALCEGATYTWDFTGGALLEDAGAEAWVAYETEGVYPVTLTVTDANGNSDTWTWEGMIEVVNEPVVPESGLSEDFNGPQFPPANWRMDVNGHAWEHAWDLVETDNGVAQFPNYWVNTEGAYDLLITPAFDPTGFSEVTFDVAHQVYASYVDGLEVWGRPGGASEWTVLWSAYGEELAVDGCYTWFWYDTGGTVQWANHSIELPADWTGGAETCLEVAFVNVGGYGNHTWIDNVNILGANDVLEQAIVRPQLFPNPNDGRCDLIVPAQSVGVTYRLYDGAGREVAWGRLTQPRTELDLGLPAGVYHLQVEGMGGVKWAIR